MKEVTLTENEERLIDKYLKFYNDLALGKILPKTEAQKHFVLVCEGRTKAETEHEIAFAKYRKIIALKKNNKIDFSGIPKFEDGYPNSDWCNENDWKKMKKRNFAEMKKQSREN